MTKCLECGSDRIETLREYKKDCDGKYFIFMCMACGLFFTREDANQSHVVNTRPDKQVLME